MRQVLYEQMLGQRVLLDMKILLWISMVWGDVVNSSPLRMLGTKTLPDGPVNWATALMKVALSAHLRGE